MTACPHPEDLATVQAAVAELRARRLAVGISLREMARRIGSTASVLCELEARPHVGMYVCTLHRMASGIAAQLRFDPGFPEVDDPLVRLLAAMWAQTGDPHYLGSHLMAQIRAERRRQRLSLVAVGERIGADQSAVHCMEQPLGRLKVSTPLRLCRALGGRLGIEVCDAT